MSNFILRLDDACEKMDIEKWSRMESLLDQYSIKPLVGVIPHCEDNMMSKYPTDILFWDKVASWIEKGWTIALHGYNHVYNTKCGGLNPVNPRSEFAGNPYPIQAEKIREGLKILRLHGINPLVFFAPSHTFDENTLLALKTESNIKFISDTWAWNTYTEYGFTFVPQQSGFVRKVPFTIATFCYHPNTMTENSFNHLEKFIKRHKSKFISFPLVESNRKKTMIDRFLSKAYLIIHKIK